MTILDTIIDKKKQEISYRKSIFSIQKLEKCLSFARKTISFQESLKKKDKNGIISEFKRKSPSKGIINANASVEEVTAGYVKANVCALSVLTDSFFFGGSSADLMAARNFNPETPILRKDFVIDSYQIVEAKAIGADVVLLIASCLTKKEIDDLAIFAKNLGLEILLEIHAEEELEKISDHVTVVGVNNRNLKDFTVDIQHSIDLFPQIPSKFLKISESGISNVETIQKLQNVGFSGFLIGENFMKTTNPSLACQEFASLL